MKTQDLNCILLVDDDEATNFIHQVILVKSKVKAQIQTMNNAKQALDYVSNQGVFTHLKDIPKPGIIFLDINMPGMSGWDFLEAYSKLPQDKKDEIAVIMLTSSLNPDDKLKSEQNPDIKAFISKPITLEKVRKITEDFLPSAN